MNIKLAFVALAALVFAIAMYLLSGADDPTHSDKPETTLATAPPGAEGSQDSNDALKGKTGSGTGDDEFIIPDMTSYDDETLLTMVDHDADAAFELGFRRYGKPAIPLHSFGNSEARGFLLRAIALEPRYAAVAIPIMMEFDSLPVSAQEAPSWGANRRLVAALLGERLGVDIDIDAEFAVYREIVPSETIHPEFRRQADTLLWRVAAHRADVTGDKKLLEQIEGERP